MASIRNVILRNVLRNNRSFWPVCPDVSKIGGRCGNCTISSYTKINKRSFASPKDKKNVIDENFSNERKASDQGIGKEATSGKNVKENTDETNKKKIYREASKQTETTERDERNETNEEKYTGKNGIEEQEKRKGEEEVDREREGEGEEEMNYENMKKIDLINEIKKTKKSINEKNLDNKILKEKYLSVLAENENLRNRYLKEIENSKIYCITNFAKSLLDVADNLSLAIQNINEESLKKNEEINNIHKGIQMTETILHNIFNNYGINKYNPINEKFDPLFHEAIYEINDVTKEKGTVATVIQHGYKIKDRILRAAKVGVVKN